MFGCSEMRSFQVLVQEVAEANDNDMGCLLAHALETCQEVVVKHVGVSSVVVESTRTGKETVLCRTEYPDGHAEYGLLQQASAGHAFLRAGCSSIGEVLEFLEREG